MIKVDENIERSISPRMEFYDGSTAPFGKYDEDGEFHLIYSATSRYGYMTHPIYGVYIGRYLYKIFVGECPHRDEKGEWVTDEKVPSFYISSFGGSHYLEEEKDFPHIIDIQTDEWRHEHMEEESKKWKSNESHDWELSQKIIYCSFGTYMKGLWNRIQRRFGRISYHKGKHSNLLTWSKYPKQLQWVNHWESKSLYFVRENDEWIRFTWFRKDGKWGFRREKRENDHTGCEA